jgi:HPt (histidine-containing phosphotransfer) domain-containing protein
MAAYLNKITLESLREVERRGGQRFVRNLIEEYFTRAEFDLHAVEAARGSGASERFQQALHSAVGAARTIGAQAIVDYLESLAFREAIGSEFDQVRQLLDESRAAFETEMRLWEQN